MPSDTFGGAAGPLSASWYNTLSAPDTIVQDGLGFAKFNNAGEDAIAGWVADTPANDHWSEITFGPEPVSGHTCGAAVCVQGTGASRACYVYQAVDGLWRVLSGVGFQQITTDPTTWAVGDKLKLERVGTTLKMYKNGVQVGSTITGETDLSGGTYGMHCYDSSGTGIEKIAFWEGQNVNQAIAIIGKTIKSRYSEDPDDPKFISKLNYPVTVRGIVPATRLGVLVKSKYSDSSGEELYISRVVRPAGGSTVAPVIADKIAKSIRSRYVETDLFNYANGVFISSPSPGIDAPVATPPLSRYIKNSYIQDADFGFQYPNINTGMSTGIIPGKPRIAFKSGGIISSFIQDDLLRYPSQYGVRVYHPSHGSPPVPPPDPIVNRSGFVGVGVKAY